MGLTAAHVKGTAALLRPSAYHLSPAVGLIAASSSVLAGNLFRHGEEGQHISHGFGPAVALAHELFRDGARGSVVRLATSRSRASAYLSPEITGHVIGLGISAAPRAVIDATLRSVGVRSNRVHDVWTGVSLARFRVLVELVREASEQSASSPAFPLLLRCVWERAESKACLLRYVLALNSHSPVLAAKYQGITEDRRGLRFNFQLSHSPSLPRTMILCAGMFYSRCQTVA